MILEIERRFLIQKDDWKKQVISSEKIQQCYLSFNFEEWIVRVRIINQNKAFITLKNSLDGLVNTELEYIIPVEDAEEILSKSTKKLTKQRYHLDLSNGSWIVDCFSGSNFPLAIAEVELKEKDSSVIKPSWCDIEITGEKLLSNAALANQPISSWSQKDKIRFKIN